MKKRRVLIVATACLVSTQLFGQNLNLHPVNNSVKIQSMAGAGLGLVKDISAIHLNPAGLSGIKGLRFSASFSEHYHNYNLINERKEESLTRIFKWDKSRSSLNSILYALPLRSRLGLGLGYVNRITPFVYNQRRALTWSPLFTQTTSGNLSGVLGSFGFQHSEHLALGLTAYHYFGSILSKVTGENHDQDLDKWVKLETRMTGNGVRIGAQYAGDKLGLGISYEPAVNLEIVTGKTISSDSLYSYLFPDDEQTDWRLPGSLALGLAYQYDALTTLAVDLEHKSYSSAEVQFNLYEYGGSPVWGNLSILRVGAERLRALGQYPLRVGYAYIPQVYASTIKNQPIGGTSSIENGDRIIKHVLSIGTTQNYEQHKLHIALQYSQLSWHGDLFTHVTIEDSYTEREISLAVEWVYSGVNRF